MSIYDCIEAVRARSAVLKIDPFRGTTQKQHAALILAIKEKLGDIPQKEYKEIRHRILSALVGFPVKSQSQITAEQIGVLIEKMRECDAETVKQLASAVEGLSLDEAARLYERRMDTDMPGMRTSNQERPGHARGVHNTRRRAEDIIRELGF